MIEQEYQNDSSYNEQLLHFNCYNYKFNLPIHEAYRRNYVAVGSVSLILAPITFILNLAVFIAFSKINGKNNITNYIYRSLCMADMLTGLLAQPAFAAFYLTVFHRKTYCSLLLIYFGCNYFFVTVSFLGLLAIHVERYLGVIYPFKHNKIKTDTIMITKLIVTGWILAAISVSLGFLTSQLIMLTVFAAALIPTVFMWNFYVQVKIVREVHRITKLRRQNAAKIDDKKDETEHHFNLVDSRANKIAGLILIAYAVCYIPDIIIYTWLYLHKSNVLLALQLWTETLVYLNSIFNPLLFSLQKREIRQIVISSVRSLLPCSTAT